MIYRPTFTRQLWDTWIFPWNNTYHLFFLESHMYLRQQDYLWTHVGRAVSEDLVHWESLPSIHTRNPQPGTWNSGPTLTGTVVECDGTFYLYIGSDWNGQQVIGLYTSSNLDHWKPASENPILTARGPHYRDTPEKPFIPYLDWRDPCIFFRPESGYYHMLLCARSPKSTPQQTGAIIGHLRSKNLLDWEYLPPLADIGERFDQAEVPDYFSMNGKHYLLFSTISRGGFRIDASDREDCRGTFALSADRFEGPYEVCENPLVLGNAYAPLMAYVGRTIPWAECRLLYHQVNSTRPAFALPKLLEPNDNASLCLKYWPGAEKLETNRIIHSIHKLPRQATRDKGQWELTSEGLFVTAFPYGSSHPVAQEVADFHLTISFASHGASRIGVIFRHLLGKGHAVIVDYSRQRLEILEVQNTSLLFGWGIRNPAVGYNARSVPIDYSHRPLEHGTRYSLRLLMRDQFIDVFLDDQWIFSQAIEEVNRAGAIDLMVDQGHACFSSLRLSELEYLV